MYTGTKEFHLSRYYERRALLIARLGGKCVRCNSINKLEFDHIDPKLKSIDISKDWGKSLDNLEEELVNCQLLCNSCHKAKTKEQTYGIRRHGTYTMYKNGACRCEACVAAYKEATRKWQKKYRDSMK
jgi:5-methylcytosine-specific restriction endonuclease McrA